MKKMILKTTALSLFAAALLAAPGIAQAQDAATNAPEAGSVQPPPSTHKARKHDHGVFNGKLKAVDTNAMTLTVGERTFEISSETKITKAGQPATLSDGVVGEPVGGAYKKNADGKLSATSVHFGAKSDGTSTEGKKKKKKAAAESTGTSTNSVAK